MKDGKKKKSREVTEEDKQAIRNRIDKGERNSSKLVTGIRRRDTAGCGNNGKTPPPRLVDVNCQGIFARRL
jgi:hypothetical protein